jgi:uncharacterized protein YhaN
MKLLEIALEGFGRFRNAQFRFHPKINVIFGPNEAGKSTLQQAIVAMLYGFYDNKRASSRERESHERFRPWSFSRSPQRATNSGNNPRSNDAVNTRAIESDDFPIPVINDATYPDASFATSEAGLSTAVLPKEEVMAVIHSLPAAVNRPQNASNAPSRLYGGSLKYSLDDGKTLLIHRDFSSEDVPTQLLDAVTGEDWLIHYHRGRHGKVDFMEKQIGMSHQVFLATACLRQGALQPLAERDASAVSDAILRLLDSAGADQSAEQAIERLEKKLRELGSDRSQNALLPQARRRLEELRESYALRLAAQRAAQEDIENAEILELELDELRQTLTTLEYQNLQTQLALLETRFTRWQENEQQRTSWAVESAALEPYRNFPVSHKETFFQLWHDFTHFDKLRAMLLNEREEIDLKLMGLAEKNKTLQVPEPTWTKFSFEDFLALRSRWDSIFQEILNNEGARLDAEEALKKAGIDEAERAAFASLDWQHLEQYKILEVQVKETEAAVRTARDEYTDYQIDMQRQRRVAALVAFVALVAFATGFINNLIGNNNPAGLNLFLALSVLGMGVFIVFNIRWVARSRELSTILLQAEDRYMEERPQLIDLLSRYRVNSIDELLQRRLQFVELGAVIQAHLQLTQELSKIEQDLTPWMNELGIGHIAPETLQDAEKRLRESHQQWSDKHNARQRLTQIEKQQQEIQQNLERLSGELGEILQEAGIAEPVGEKAFQLFSTGCQRREYLETLQIQLQQAEVLGKEILADETSEEIADRIKRLQKDLPSRGSTADTRPATASDTTLTANTTNEAIAIKRPSFKALSLAELQTRRESIQTEIHHKEQKRAALRERVAARLQGLPPLAEIEEEIALVEAEVARLEIAREELELARDFIAQAAQQLRRDFAPRLNRFLEKYLDQLTANRYNAAMVDPTGFSVRLLGPAASHPVELNRLSFGAIEQVYLLLRAAVVEFFTENHESIPMLLDDPLVHADSERIIQGLHIIDALADSHQIFYFTKDPVVLDYFRGKPEGCAIITLSDGSTN